MSMLKTLLLKNLQAENLQPELSSFHEDSSAALTNLSEIFAFFSSYSRLLQFFLEHFHYLYK